MVNRVILVGRLGHSPKLKDVGSSQVATFSVALNRKWTQNGETKEEVTWVDCEAWGKTAAVCSEYLKSGSQVYVEGRLKVETWEKEDKKHKRMLVAVESIRFLDRKDETKEDPF